MIFDFMELAQKYCKGKGIELGAAAHNPFGLDDCINIAPGYDEQFFKLSQLQVCGHSRPIDFYGDAQNIPRPDDSYDYIISSHVVEHVPDLISAFLEFNRVLKKDGVIFMIFPKKNALPADVGRPVSTLDDFIKGFEEKRIADHDWGHVWIFTLQNMLELIEYCNKTHNLGWEIVATEETDSKVGNGHTVVCRRK